MSEQRGWRGEHGPCEKWVDRHYPRLASELCREWRFSNPNQMWPETHDPGMFWKCFYESLNMGNNLGGFLGNDNASAPFRLKSCFVLYEPSSYERTTAESAHVLGIQSFWLHFHRLCGRNPSWIWSRSILSE